METYSSPRVSRRRGSDLLPSSSDLTLDMTLLMSYISDGQVFIVFRRA